MKEPRVYEIGYLLIPTIKEEDIDTHVDALRKMITEKGGLPISEGRPELIELAYPMQKDIENKRHTYTKGFFGWVKFDISPEQTMILKKEMDLFKGMIRFLLISTVREDTRVKIAHPTKGSSRTGNDADTKESTDTSEVAVQAPVLSEDEIDAKIDEMAGEE